MYMYIHVGLIVCSTVINYIYMHNIQNLLLELKNFEASEKVSVL